MNGDMRHVGGGPHKGQPIAAYPHSSLDLGRACLRLTPECDPLDPAARFAA